MELPAGDYIGMHRDEIDTQPPFQPGFGRLVPNWP